MSINVNNLGDKMDNVAVFRDTRNQSQTTYDLQTKRLIDETRVFTEPDKEIDVPVNRTYGEIYIKFSYGGTVSTAYEYATGGATVAMLNFADALVPGGLVLAGEVTQEENICRCTNLYESLISPLPLARYYNRNNQMLNIYPHYTNALIYSPDVLIFKDDMDYHEISPVTADVITCPAPAGGDSKQMAGLLKERIRGIIKAATLREVDVLILGAWGCGAFGQDPAVIGKLFGEVLKNYNGYFRIIDFAIRNNDGSKSRLAEIFEKNFWEGYHNHND